MERIPKIKWALNHTMLRWKNYILFVIFWVVPYVDAREDSLVNSSDFAHQD